MFAAVDLGSNSFRLHVGKYQSGAIKVVKSARDPIGLAGGLDRDNVLSDEAIATAIDSLKRFRLILDAYKLDALRVVATNTIRVAQNRLRFLPLLEQAIGHPIEIISGEEEGRLIYMGVANTVALDQEQRLVVDIGGGSTELIVGYGADVLHVESFSIGTTTPGKSFFPSGRLTAAGYDGAILSARSTFEDAATIYQSANWTNVYGSSGTLRALADAIEKNQIGDRTLSYANLLQLKTLFVAAGHVDRIDLAGLKTARVGVVVGGLAVLLGLMQQFSLERLQPIEAGLRMGVMWDLLLRGTTNDRREQSVLALIRRFHVDETRARYVAEAARALFAMQNPSRDNIAPYLYWAALLHEIGLIVSQSGYHKHGAYLVANADIAGYNTREQKLMSQLILGQKGNLRKISDGLGDLDMVKALLSIRFSVMFLHSHAAIRPEQLHIRHKQRIDIEIQKGLLAQHPTAAYWMQREVEWWRNVGIEMVIGER